MITEIETFSLPISYLDDNIRLEEHLINDLELKSKDDENKSLYEYIFNPGEITFAQKTIPLWSEYYTSNKQFIKESQKLITSKLPKLPKIDISNNYIKVQEIWKEIVAETSFEEKYQYLDWKWLSPLNNNSNFLQCMSLYNITSPVISLALPIFLLIIPFFLLKLQGISITMNTYIDVLKQLFQRHQLGQILSVGSASWEKRVYILVTCIFYIMQVYQNVSSCIKFGKNMKKLHEQIFVMRDYADETIKRMDSLELCCKNLKTYNPFIEELQQKRHILTVMRDDFNKVSPNELSFGKIFQVGHLLKCFYQLYNRQPYHDALNYSFGFNGYIHNLSMLKKMVLDGHISKCKLSNKTTKFKNAYFPTLIHKIPVKNSYTLDTNILITGPNAAGKTTMLKTTIFNILFSQQTGFGCYDSAVLAPFDKIHCYINIPDTSGRDSLFQAEARRCKNILNDIENTESNSKIDENTQFRHFCVFDELYSGTNPYEAIGSATSYLKYLNKYNNVTYMITTHFIDLCNRLDKEKNVLNCHMKINNNGDNFNYTYKLDKGVSNIKGGIKVLQDLEYPNEIIIETKKIINELII